MTLLSRVFPGLSHRAAPSRADGRIVIASASGVFPRSRNLFARVAARPAAREHLRHVRRSYGVMSFHVGWLLDAGGDLVRFVEEHGIGPTVGHVFSFEEIGEGHWMLKERRNVGKVVVRVA